MISIARVSAILSIICLASAPLADDFYYGTDGRVPVIIDPAKVMVQPAAVQPRNFVLTVCEHKRTIIDITIIP